MARSFARILPGRLPIWTVSLFSAGFVFAMSPNLLKVFGIHNDYEQLIFKNHGLLFHEAEHLFAIARPVAALLSNLTLLPAESISDFRWTRVFSTATVCLLGFQMMSICVRRLRVDPFPAVVLALAAFLTPAFIYSTLNPTAWAPHLVSILIGFLAYEILSNSNVQAIPFVAVVQSGNPRSVWRQLRAYCALRAVWGACIVLQIALYDYPPTTLVIAALPVVAVLFSRAPGPYRAVIAIRDIGFVVANLAIYTVTAKAIYLPIVGLLTYRDSEVWRHSQLSAFDARAAVTYQYKFNLDPGVMLQRLGEIGKVSGNLWFLPQTQAHVLVAATIGLALAVLSARWLMSRANDRPAPSAGLLALAIAAVCFLLAASPILAASGGVTSYRAFPACLVIAAIVFVFAVQRLAGVLGAAIGRSPGAGTAVASVALFLTGGAAVAANFNMNYLTMKLARNETAYFDGIVRQAIDNHSNAVVIIDPRPFTLPDDYPVAYDETGHAVPPYELSCFSSICLQNGAIVTILAEQSGVPRGKLGVHPIVHGDPIPNASCEMLTGPTPNLPAGAPERVANMVKYLRSLTPVTCVSYSLAWHNVDLSP
jgi:hypothetical protein